MIQTVIEAQTYSLSMTGSQQEDPGPSRVTPLVSPSMAAPLPHIPPKAMQRRKSTAASTHVPNGLVDSKIAFKKARTRPTLSCTECVRRRQCDRCVPCCTCIQRGVPEKCRIEELEDFAPPQPFALASEQAQMKLKIQELEERLRSLENVAPDSLGASRIARPSIPLDYSQIPSSGVEPDAPTADGETDEQAAFALETLALDGRTTRNPLSLPLTHSARTKEQHLNQVELDMLVSMIPEWEFSLELVDIYFRFVDWENHVIHVPTFENQHTLLRKLLDQRRLEDIDFSWLALYFVVLASALFFSPNYPDLSHQEQQELIHSWILGAQRALNVADIFGYPTISCIQTILVMPNILMHSGGIRRWASYLSTGIRMSHLLDLKGDKSQRTTKDKEVGRRLYCSLIYSEVNFSGRWLGLGPAEFHFASPTFTLQNCDDNDLVAHPPIIRSIDAPTQVSYQIILNRITEQDNNWRKVGGGAGGKHNYDTVRKFDSVIDDLKAGLPEYFKLERSDEAFSRKVDMERPYIAWQRCLIVMQLENRLMRAHRHYLEAGYRDRKYSYSTDLCIKSAKTILAAQRALRQSLECADRLYNNMLACLSASIVLMVENLHRLSSNQNVTPESLDVNRSESLDSFIWFSRVAPVSTIAKVAVDVLKKLLDEEERRRASRGMGIIENLRLVNGGETMIDLKYETRTLREVVGSISNAPMPHYLTNSVPFTPPGGHQTLSHHSHSQSPQSPDRHGPTSGYGSIQGTQQSSPPYFTPMQGQQVFGNTSDEFLKGLDLYDMGMDINNPSQVIGPMDDVHTSGVLQQNGAPLQEIGWFGLL